MKKRPAKARSTKRAPVRKGRTNQRVRTYKPNGAPSESVAVPNEQPVSEAIKQAIEDLGDIVIDDQLAPSQMRQLAECYENVAKEQAAFARKNDAAKIAKKALESATALLLEKVRAFTHPVALPLFDQQQREEDQQEMIEGGAVDTATTEPPTEPLFDPTQRSDSPL